MLNKGWTCLSGWLMFGKNSDKLTKNKKNISTLYIISRCIKTQYFNDILILAWDKVNIWNNTLQMNDTSLF